MKIKWFGQACFLITSNNGIRIITDPFDHRLGYDVPSVEADIVTASHDHYDHNNVASVKGEFIRIDKPGKFLAKGIDIVGVETFHDESKGSKRGKNTVFKFSVDGINICHCGDLGHVLSDEQAERLGKVDILLVPVGGTYTVNAVKAWEIVKQLNPVVTIPMHFKTKAISLPIEGVERFLSVAGKGLKTGKQEIELDKSNISDFKGVVLLEYK